MGDDNNDTERGRDPAEGARDTADEAIAEHTSDEPRVVAPGPMSTAPSSTPDLPELSAAAVAIATPAADKSADAVDCWRA